MALNGQNEPPKDWFGRNHF